MAVTQHRLVHTLVKILAVITCFGSYLIVLMGTLVTTTDSGQGCGGTWPFCHGQIIPGVLTVAGVIEYSHRVFAGADGILVILITVATWLLYRRDFRAKFFAAMSLLFIVVQGALGAFTVVVEGTLALPWILSVHFGLSLIAFASVVLLAVRIFQLDRQRTSPSPVTNVERLQLPIWGLALYTFIVTYTGALGGCDYGLWHAISRLWHKFSSWFYLAGWYSIAASLRCWPVVVPRTCTDDCDCAPLSDAP